MSVLNDYLTEIQDIAQDKAPNVSFPDKVKGAFLRALECYNQDRPLIKVVEVAATESGDVPLASLTGYAYEFSDQIDIEYPINDVWEPRYLDRSAWMFLRKPSGLLVRLLSRPPAGELIRFTYPIPHVVDDNGSTVPATDFYALCKKGAAEVLKMISRSKAGNTENTFLNADIAQFGQQQDKYRTAARDLDREYAEHMAKSVKPVSSTMVVRS
jgi:hypothetical protein